MWKVVKDYPKYIIDESGVILSSSRGFREVRPQVDKDGYLRVNLCHKNRKKHKLVHRLVAEAFAFKTSDIRNVVNHKDSDRKNNHITNLEWVTVKENNEHAYIYGKARQKGVANKSSKLNNTQVLEIKRRLSLGQLYINIAKDFPVTPTTIGRINRSENWTHL